MFYVYEDMNCTAVGAFSTHAQARAFKCKLPQQDLANAHGINSEGYRGWLVLKHANVLRCAGNNVVWESEEQCKARYLECIAAGYYPAQCATKLR